MPRQREIYKDIIGYEGIYQFSNLKNVKSLARKYSPNETILTPGDTNGYLQVSLSKNGKEETRYIHQLVTEYYYGPCPEGLECRHLDGSKDNEPENLKYGTHSENMLDCRRHGTSTNNAHKRRPVKCIETGEIYKSATEASRQTGISRSGISQCCNGKQKIAGGYHWEFISKEEYKRICNKQ